MFPSICMDMSGGRQIHQIFDEHHCQLGKPRLTVTNGIDHCLWHHGGCSSAATKWRRVALQTPAVTDILRETSSRFPTADLSKIGAAFTASRGGVRRGSGSLAKPKVVSTPSDEFPSVILRGFQERSAKRPRTTKNREFRVREWELCRRVASGLAQQAKIVSVSRTQRTLSQNLSTFSQCSRVVIGALRRRRDAHKPDRAPARRVRGGAHGNRDLPNTHLAERR